MEDRGVKEEVVGVVSGGGGVMNITLLMVLIGLCFAVVSLFLIGSIESIFCVLIANIWIVGGWVVWGLRKED